MRNGARGRGDAGLSITEVLIALTIFALFALVFAPLMIRALWIANDSSLQVAATQAVSGVLDRVQAESSCGSLDAYAGTVAAAGPRGESLEVTTTVAACPTTLPGTVRVEVVATGEDVAVTASTLVYVGTS